MKRSACMTLGELREATKDMPDRTCLMVVGSIGYEDCALPLQPYPFCTTLDQQDIYLLQFDPSESVTFLDC